MEIEETPIYQEIKEIIDEGPKPIAFYYKAKVHTPEGDYEVMKVIDTQITRDYIANAGDEIRTTLLIPLGLWAKLIFPYRTELEITLIKAPLQEVGDEAELDETIESKRYIATPNPDNMPVIDGRDINKLTASELDLKDIFQIEFQLHDRVAYQLRLITCGGVFRRVTGEQVVKYLLATESSKHTKSDDAASFQGVDFIECNNKDKREHLVIPHGTNLVDLPVYIQKNAGGLYSTGVGCYYQNRYWFVYPLWDTQRYDKATKTLKIIKVPVVRYTGIERTYREEGDTTYILATSNSEISDDSYTNFAMSGNGTRFADSRQFIRNFVDIKDNKAIASRGKSNHEFLFVDRGEERNAVYMSKKRISSNPYVQRSELAGKKGQLFVFVWENSNPDLVFPGIMCKIHYMNSDELMEINGVVLAANTSVRLAGVGITGKRHVTATTMVIFANPSEAQATQEPEDEDEVTGVDNWEDYEAI